MVRFLLLDRRMVAADRVAGQSRRWHAAHD